jgi:long-subunit acyl-CoA synthetase (AMP-forming)
MTPGYHNRSEADKDLFTMDEQGRRWLRTGDVVEMDEHQNIWIMDRLKECVTPFLVIGKSDSFT